MPDRGVGLAVAVGVLVVAGLFGLLRRRADGRMRPVTGGPGTDGVLDRDLLTGLGVPSGARVTLLQFSSAFCAPCRATRRICAEVSDLLDGVAYVEVDAESHLAAVRELGIRRTPTVLVVDAAGRVVRRASGQPTRAQVVAAVAPLLTT